MTDKSYSFLYSSFQVPNIRFNVAKELKLLAPICGEEVFESQIVPVLNILVEDTDRDVRFFSEKTASELKNGLTNKEN